MTHETLLPSTNLKRRAKAGIRHTDLEKEAEPTGFTTHPRWHGQRDVTATGRLAEAETPSSLSGVNGGLEGLCGTHVMRCK